ncbi:hypothetical protein Agabi119p4_7484 [Agaricus bisporus var. burnettii]|uniref:F-box domain-containing protein n=1 Tax=Agaricus bisporus var. burnettii TaxID=192524 RepID=A0A8H7C870_AGABI|nr:hypothetical protein Agabi119p4_7484 [Agaricus bisporus var. burnettii]
MNCYACGQRVSPESSFQDISAAEEVSSILRTTEHLGDLILSLNAARVKLLQRLNQLRASTRVCPPEILSTIFQHASPPTDLTALEFLEEDEDGSVSESHRQVTLSAVSWHWRQVIFATPQLWTNAVVNVTRKNAERKAQLLQLYLTNVGNMTISLALYVFPGYGRLILKSELDPVINCIWNGAQKFKLLSLCSIPQSFISFSPADFTQLEDLRLKWTWDDLSGFHTTQISAFPRLRQLYLWGALIHLPSQPLCQSLTILRFFDTPLHISIQMLILCPNLVEYTCHQTSIDITETIPQVSEPITFPHMKIFYSPCSADALIAPILHKFKFPALEALGLELGPNKDGLEELVSFIRNTRSDFSISSPSSSVPSSA